MQQERQNQVKYLLIGSGRMASHFQHYLNLLGLTYTTWSRGLNNKKQLISQASDCTHVVLLISDPAIQAFVAECDFLKEKILVHFSGGLSVPDIHSAHPLMTFNTQLYDLATYQSVVFILEEKSLNLEVILPGLSNRFFKIPSSAKPYYHALCVMSGNFTTILWKKLFDELETRFEIPKNVAFPYLNRIAQNLVMDSNSALTGPLARNDKVTINKHIESLHEDKFKCIYEAFVEMFHGNK